MKKKLIKVANQIIDLEKKLQAGENMQDNLAKMEKLLTTLSTNEIFEVYAYLEEKLGFKIDN
jgi:hypothetical protein